MNRRPINPQVEQASGDFDRRKAMGIMPGMAAIARLYRINPKTLKNYRANYVSRKTRKR